MKTAKSGLPIMGGKGESGVSECKSLTSGSRNSFSQDDKRGELKGRKPTGKSTSGDKKADNAEPSNLTYTSEEDVYYEPGDCVYIDSQRADVPYFICAIKEFRMSKRESLVVMVRWYYRPSEVPESVYQLLIQDRNAENGSGDNILEDVAVKERELFISDATDVYPASALRGKCKVRPFVEITDSVKGYIQKEDSFFYILGYNPETRRLANTKGEIRVGVSHQAILPECSPYPMNGSADEIETSKEQLVWRPFVDDYELMMFLRAARSMAQYAGMCNGGSPEDGYRVVSQDATTTNALNVLHQNNYDAAKALQTLVKKPYPKELENSWSEEDMKKFVKGLRQYGKNFYKIRKDLLPHKQTGELVQHYYTWKKTPTALSSRPHRRRRHNVLRRKALPRPSKNIASEFVDLSSCSEDDYDSDDSERDLSLYCCRHCYTTESRSWHHGSQNKVILCGDCRVYYKKYGKMPTIEEVREPPAYMFKSVVEREARVEADTYLVNGKLALRSRRAIPPVQTTLRSGRNKTSSPVEGATSESSGGSRRLAKINKVPSPSSASSSSTGSSGGKDKLKKGKFKKGKKRQRELSPDEQSTDKRKKALTQDSDEDANDNASDTSSTTGGRDSVLPDHDASSVCSNSSNNDDAGSNRSSSPIGTRIEGTGAAALPCNFKRVISDEEGRSCVRTDVIFVQPEKPRKESVSTRETSVSKTSPSKSEVNEPTSEAPVRSSANKSPLDTPATITSHYESSLRNMMAGGPYHVYPSNFSPALASQGIALPGFSQQGVGVDYRMLPFHAFPGAGAIPGSESRENAAKFAEGFDQWYAPYRMAQMQSAAAHHVPAISYLQGQGRGLEMNALDSRSAAAHEALIKGGSTGRIITDPITGLQYYGSSQHSHSHLHTHFHIHPHEQHLSSLQAANLASIDPAYVQHPGLTTWRNHPSLWQHPELLHLHGNGARGVFPEELAHAAVPVHGLGSTPMDRQLQQQLMLSQHSKYHQHSYQHQQQLMAHDELMRCWRQHKREQHRLESDKMNEHFLSNLFRKEPRNLQSPSQLDNVVKKSLDSSGVYSSPQKKTPVTIDLSDD